MNNNTARFLIIVLLCVASVCCFLIYAYISNEKLKTSKERELEFLQDSYYGCLRRSGSPQTCMVYMQFLKNPEKPKGE